MSEHRAQIRVYANGQLHPAGTTMNYAGEPSWVWEPVDEQQREAWLRDTADPDRVRHDRFVNEGRRWCDPMIFDPPYGEQVRHEAASRLRSGA